MTPNRSNGPSTTTFSPELLAIAERSNPWLAASQKASPVHPDRFPSWDLEADEGVIWFSDGERRGLVARVHAIATFSREDRKFVWGWASEGVAPLAERAQALCAERPEIPEFGLTLIETDETGAWLLAAAVAHEMGVDVCYRLPGPLATFVGLSDLTELAEDDPRSTIPTTDPAAAADALAEFAGAAAIQLGAALYRGVQEGKLDDAIQAVHTVADRLDALVTSPVGKGTVAAAQAAELASELRSGAASVSLPPEHPGLQDALMAFFAFLERVARRYGAVEDATEGG